VAIRRWTWDNKGNLETESNYGIDEQLVENNAGIALASFEYDKQGNPLAMERFNRKNVLISD